MDYLTINLGVIAIAGVVASILTAVVNKAWWTRERKQWVSLIVSVVLGVVALIIDGVLTQPPTEPAEIITWAAGTVAAVAAASQLVYAQFSEKLKVLEDITSESTNRTGTVE